MGFLTMDVPAFVGLAGRDLETPFAPLHTPAYVIDKARLQVNG